jgi:hypothetical protein
MAVASIGAESLDRWCPLMVSIYGSCSEELIKNYLAPHPYAKLSQVPKERTPVFHTLQLANGSLLSMYESPEKMEEKLAYLGVTMG